MGCEESRTIEETREYAGRFNEPGDLILKVINGILDTSLPFGDCLITSNDELTKNIKDFISTRKPMANNPNQFEPNINDELITDSIAIDFTKNHVIALNAVKVLKICNIGGNYVVFHNNQSGSIGHYSAFVVKKIGGAPKLMYGAPKPKPID